MNDVIDFTVLQRKQSLSKELTEWRRRIKLCYENDWADPCMSICQSEIKRLTELMSPNDICYNIMRERK